MDKRNPLHFNVKLCSTPEIHYWIPPFTLSFLALALLF